ncbi:hypothetical protein BWQ96_08810 [Gracilariopsis chorda]|uniref:Uncharacterized protein n=1 Tax=Gracilariopsis chorda TaxID=448386 RepID=A0A2V3IHA9_9FLOR|nr:hypothetical protein BWQ96_08810 [Gracilariopsis chorda]|eukprot:PXF41475.1 hypothetical protein BWQ96_08810 [Gracilariopsis chorda]
MKKDNSKMPLNAKYNEHTQKFRKRNNKNWSNQPGTMDFSKGKRV